MPTSALVVSLALASLAALNPLWPVAAVLFALTSWLGARVIGALCGRAG